MKITIPFLFLLLLAGCTSAPVTQLKNTRWSSDFYYYHNNYHFTTDSTGETDFCMLAMGMGDLLHDTLIPGDSILCGDVRAFHYTLKDTTLTLRYDGNEPEDPQVFHLRKDEKGNPFFVSDFEYAYGREILGPEKTK